MFFSQFPQTEDDWKIIGNDFEKRFNFPHCVGALGGEHIEIIPPPYFYNHKQKHSMALLAVADAKRRF